MHMIIRISKNLALSIFLTAHLNGQNCGGRYCRLILEGERTENPCSPDRTLLCSWGVSITSHTGMHFSGVRPISLLRVRVFGI